MKKNFSSLFVLSLLMTCMSFSICSCSENGEPLTRIIPTEKVELDADTIQEIDGMKVIFQILNAEGLPTTSFKEGELFTFVLVVTNTGNDYLELPTDMFDSEAFSIFSADGTYLYKPWDYFQQRGMALIRLAPMESVRVSCKAFGEKDLFEGQSDIQKISLLKSNGIEPLPRGKYYTQFSLNLKVKGGNLGQDMIIEFKKNFDIE